MTLDRDVLAAVEHGFRTPVGGSVVMPPILSMAIEDANGEVDVKTAYVPGVPSFAIKVSPGFFDNPKIGLPSTSGLMVLFSATTGRVEVLLLDNGYLTDVRTAAAGAVACLGAAAMRIDALSGKACLGGRFGQDRVQFAVQARHDRRERPEDQALVRLEEGAISSEGPWRRLHATTRRCRRRGCYRRCW